MPQDGWSPVQWAAWRGDCAALAAAICHLAAPHQAPSPTAPSSEVSVSSGSSNHTTSGRSNYTTSGSSNCTASGSSNSSGSGANSERVRQQLDFRGRVSATCMVWRVRATHAGGRRSFKPALLL